MATKRRKLIPYQLDRMTDAQRSHLECGHYFFDFRGEADHFRDEEHRLATWQAQRHKIMAAWDRAGERPDAFWQYDVGIKGSYGEWRWPRGIESERHMVHRLLTEGTIEPIGRGVWWHTKTELEEIESMWLEYVRQGFASGDGMAHACGWGGVPKAFYRRHAPAIRAEQEAQRAEFKARIEHGRGVTNANQA